MKLSEAICKNTKPKQKLYKLFDGGGLYLEVTPSGGKHWKLKYYHLRKEKKLPLGEYPIVTLKEAREKREEAKRLLDKNIDPAFAKREADRMAILDNANTFEAIAREWHEYTKEKWSAGHAKTILTRMEMHLFPHIGSLPIKSISSLILLDALKQVEKGGVYETTKRARQYASQVFRYAVITGRAERDVSFELAGALKHAKVQHHAALDIKELPEFLDKLNRNDARLFIQTRLAIELMLLTFVRTSELLEAKWEEFDLADRTWIIPAERMKMRKAHIVPLANQTVQILERLKATNSQWEYILPSPIAPKKPVSENTILYALYRMGYRGKATGHGFRALAMSTIKEKLGYRHEVIDRQLAHAHRNSVDAAYDRAAFLQERRKMMQEWADYVYSLRTEDIKKTAA